MPVRETHCSVVLHALGSGASECSRLCCEIENSVHCVCFLFSRDGHRNPYPIRPGQSNPLDTGSAELSVALTAGPGQ